jgi:hypothetical protein
LVQGTESQVFTITNIGEGTSGVVTPTLQVDTSYASVTSTCGTTPLASLATCTATVTTVASTVVGLHNTATLTAVSSVDPTNQNSASFTLVEQVVQPAAITLTHGDGTDFGSTGTPAGGTGSTLTITVNNGTGTQDTQQDSGLLNVSLSNSTDFAVVKGSSSCYDSVTTKAYTNVIGGGSCTIVVQFNPTAAGAKTTTLSVGATPGGTTQTVALTGLGLSDLIISPAGTAAAPTALGGTPATGTFVVTNIGSDSTKLLRESVGGTNASSFVITNDTCFGQSLGAGQSCSVTLLFVGTSSTTTAQTASLTSTDGAAATNNSATAFVKVGGP